MLLDYEDYGSKIVKVLHAPSFVPITTVSTTYLEETSKIWKFLKNDKSKQQLIPRKKSSMWPKFGGLPKIHQGETPLRPNVSSRTTATTIGEKLLPHAEGAKSQVKDARRFIEVMKKEDIPLVDMWDWMWYYIWQT